jgi:hypothetical protein
MQAIAARHGGTGEKFIGVLRALEHKPKVGVSVFSSLPGGLSRSARRPRSTSLGG